MTVTRAALAALLLAGSAGPLRAQGPDASWLRPPPEEVALARSAAPPAVSDSATVWVLRSEGFRVAEEGSNGFHCMVRRLRHPADVIPVCFNPEAAESVMPWWQELVVEVRAGRPFPEAWSEAMERLEAGEAALPEAGQAIAYMMSERTVLTHPETGERRGYVPHFMVFVPYLTDADVGASRDDVDGVPVPFVAFDGDPGAYLMIPTGPVGEGIPVRGSRGSARPR